MKAKRLNWAKQSGVIKMWTSGDRTKLSLCVVGMEKSFILTVKHPTKIMIWSVISGKVPGRLYVVKGMMWQDQYKDASQNRLILQLEEWFPNGEPYIFMQARAPCHTARSIQAFLEEQNIPLLDWPHNSPDMNTIKNACELTAIKLGLEAIINESDYGELWILSDSRSSLQHLHNWTQVGDKTSISILHNLKLISKHHDVHFQWIPSHVDIFGNEQADRLAREGCSLLTTSSPAITYSEHQSEINRQLSKEWKIPLSLSPSHHWYAARELGSFLDLNCDRASKTAISRLASGHTKSLSFFEGRKTFKFCSKCKVQQASAEHILDCLCLSREDLYDSPLLVVDFLRINNLMDLV
ncbi:RNase H domain-containing protein [Trichonephila clavipes]|nr:RNase H domain-containing protein [Trichonephila clavipes]